MPDRRAVGGVPQQQYPSKLVQLRTCSAPHRPRCQTLHNSMLHPAQPGKAPLLIPAEMRGTAPGKARPAHLCLQGRVERPGLRQLCSVRRPPGLQLSHGGPHRLQLACQPSRLQLRAAHLLQARGGNTSRRAVTLQDSAVEAANKACCVRSPPHAHTSAGEAVAPRARLTYAAPVPAPAGHARRHCLPAACRLTSCVPTSSMRELRRSCRRLATCTAVESRGQLAWTQQLE